MTSIREKASTSRNSIILFWFSSKVICRMFLSIYAVDAARSYVQFLPLQLFSCLNTIIEMLRDVKWKATQYYNGFLSKEIFWSNIKMCSTCSYLNINWLKNPIHLNIIFFSAKEFCRVLLPSKYTQLMQPDVVYTFYYPSYFLALIPSSNYYKTLNEIKRDMVLKITQILSQKMYNILMYIHLAYLPQKV